MKEPNWQIICLQIRSKYKPLSQVAKEVGSDWRHLNRLARGDVKEPKFMVGVRLLDIHHDCYKQKDPQNENRKNN